MIFTLPGLKLQPQPAWQTQRQIWLHQAEELIPIY